MRTDNLNPPSVWAGIGRGDKVVEEIFLKGWDGGGRERFAAGRRGDDGQELELSERGSRDKDALGVRAGVGRGEVEASVLDKVVGESEVDGSEAFEDVRRPIRGTKGHAEPKAFGERFGKESTAGEALGVCGVV